MSIARTALGGVLVPQSRFGYHMRFRRFDAQSSSRMRRRSKRDAKGDRIDDAVHDRRRAESPGASDEGALHYAECGGAQSNHTSSQQGVPFVDMQGSEDDRGHDCRRPEAHSTHQSRSMTPRKAASSTIGAITIALIPVRITAAIGTP